MQFKVAFAEFSFCAVEHGADAARFHVQRGGQFFVGEAAGPQDQHLRLRWFDGSQHGADVVALLPAENVVQRPWDKLSTCMLAGRVLVLDTASGSAQCVDAQVSSSAV